MAELHEELKQIRENRGITQTQIVEKIKIRADFLERLENGDLTFVPMPFVRGFIREYAKVIGIEPDMALQRLDNKIPTLLTENIYSEQKAESNTTVQSEPPGPHNAPAVEKKAKKTAEPEIPVEVKAEEPPGPQTSLFDDSAVETEPEPEKQIETPAPEIHDDISGEPVVTGEAQKASESAAKEKTTVPEAEPPLEENIPDISAETPSLPAVSEQETSETPLSLKQAEMPEEMEKRAPLEIKEAESPGNVAFFIFIAVLILFAVIILLVNRGSLF